MIYVRFVLTCTLGYVFLCFFFFPFIVVDSDRATLPDHARWGWVGRLVEIALSASVSCSLRLPALTNATH